jgi:NADH dehydrogenase
MASKILILGGGFGGFYAAKALEKHAPKDTTITLINNTNYLTYAPLMPGVAAGTLDPRHIVMPLRDHLKRTQLRVGWVTGGDPQTKQVHVEMVSGREHTFDYDHLIVALGSVSRIFPIPGLVEYGVGFKTIEEATALRNRIIHNMELAEGLDDPFDRRAYLSFVFVGGGYAGLEGAAELQLFANDVLKLYPRCAETGLKFLLVDVAPRVMPEIQPPLAEWAMALLEKRGMEFKVNTSVSEVAEDHIVLSTGAVVQTRTLVWTAGVKPSPIGEHLGLPLDRGRIKTLPNLRVEGFDNVWSVGDVAAVPNPAIEGSPCPPTAQHAIREGKLLGKNIAAVLNGREPKPFTFKTLGSFADIGRRKAVANLTGIKVKGFPAWIVSRTYHLAWMPGWDRRFRLIADWTVGSLFPRDIAEMTRIGHTPPLDQPILPPAPNQELPPPAVTEVPGAPEQSLGPTVG